jgi:preprotein translocase subunit SecD
MRDGASTAPDLPCANIEISGEFDQQRAANLALLLNYGALPVHLHVER